MFCALHLEALNFIMHGWKWTAEFLIWLALMNIIVKNDEGKMQEIHSYIGQEGNSFTCVAHTEGLDEPGVIFSYMSYVRMLEANLPTLRDFFYSNIGYIG